MHDAASADARVAAILDAKRAAAAQQLGTLRDMLKQSDGYDETEAWRCTDAALLRFLESAVVHKGLNIKSVNVMAATKAVIFNLRWRAENCLNTTPPLRETHCCEGCEANACAHCFFSVGRDRRGWECLYLCPGRSGIKEPSSVIRHMVLTLESVFEAPFEGSRTSAARLEGSAACDVVAAGAGATAAAAPFLATAGAHAPASAPASAPAAAASAVAAEDAPLCQPAASAFASQAVLLIDLHGFGFGDADPRLALRMVPLFLHHYPDRIAQAVILDAPWIFKGIWSMVAPLLDDVGQMKCKMLRGEAMASYFDEFLHAQQAAFMAEVVKLRARPDPEGFPPSCAAVRRSLGPADKWTRDVTESLSA